MSTEKEKERSRKWYREHKERHHENGRKWAKLNPEKINESRRKWKERNKGHDREYYLKNSELIKSRSAKWYRNNTERACKVNEQWRKNNPEKVRSNRAKLLKKYLRENQNFVILKNLRNRIYCALHGKIKVGRTRELLGCSIEDFKIYIESKFEPEMSWSNYAKVWEIDHIMPCAIFDMSKADHQRRCFHFSNLQPLLISHNRRKKDKIISDQYPLI